MIVELKCAKCRDHWMKHEKSLTFAFNQVASSQDVSWIADFYFNRYHNRGHRRVLRDD